MNAKIILNSIYGAKGQYSFLDYVNALIDAGIAKDGNEIVNALMGNKSNCVLPLALNYGYTIGKENNKISVTIWKNIPNFKIKAKSDVRKFLSECLCANQIYMIKCREDYAIFIDTTKDKPIQISVKFGDLSNIFNPLLVLDEHEALNTLWFYRKKINEQFFS